VRRYGESSEFDQDIEDYQIALERQVRPATSFGLVAASGETEFVDDIAPNYRIDQLFLRVNRTLSRSTLTADLGTNEISSDTQSRRDPLLNFAWNRFVGTRSNLGIIASKGFTGTGDIGTGGSGFATATPFERQRVGVLYGLTGGRTDAAFGINAGEEDYAGGSEIDNDYESVNLEILYRATTRLDVGLRYERYDREYQDSTMPAASQADRTTGIWLNRNLNRRLSIAFSVWHYETISDRRVDETTWEFRFVYSPTGDTSSAMGSVGR
jgi:hypothetical protein